MIARVGVDTPRVVLAIAGDLGRVEWLRWAWRFTSWSLLRGDHVSSVPRFYEGVVLRVNRRGRSVDVAWTTHESLARFPGASVAKLRRARSMGVAAAVRQFGSSPLYARYPRMSGELPTVWVERGVDPRFVSRSGRLGELQP